MNHYNTIISKLEAFIRRYYQNELIKGAILFFSMGLLYFLFTLLVEHFLWLSTTGRTLLFWLFVLVELVLFVKFIAVPLAKLLKINKGIAPEVASKIIGNHFSEVNDKLLNVLQLKQQSKQQSDLLLASIEQKAAALRPIPFKLAINFRHNIKYLKYAAIPLLLIALIALSGNFNWFSDSYKRVVNYQTAYQPPAPFTFFVLNESLTATEDKDFTILVKTEGNMVPENAQIVFQEETYFLNETKPGFFQFIIEKPSNSISFYFQANNVRSKPYNLKVIKAPKMSNFEMYLQYPSYTKKRNESIKNTGNTTVPQGTRITWRVQANATQQVKLYALDTTIFKENKANEFQTSKTIYSPLSYQITTSNKHLQDYENLSYKIDVVKDQYPEIVVKMQVDSLDTQSLYFQGQVSDDYGLSKLQLVYYPEHSPEATQQKTITIATDNVANFLAAFPDNLQVQTGIAYQLYFEVFDNDAIHKGKSVKSQIFSYRKRTQNEEENLQMQQQNNTIKDLSKSLENFDKQNKELQNLTKTQKEKSELNFNDKQKLQNFLTRQKQQEALMQNYNKQLQENFKKQDDPEDTDPFKESLKERLKQNEEQLKKDEKLLDELEKLQEKINKEQFTEKLEQLAKQNKNQKRSLEQLLELTKKYYVTKKLEKLQQELEQLAKKQENLADEDDNKNTKEKQKELNEAFEDFQKQMDDLENDNKQLKQPQDLNRDKRDEEKVKQDQQEATDNLEEKEKSTNTEEANKKQQKAKQKQKQAAQRMQEMSKQMQSAMMQSGQEQMSEDADKLRQVLDNLLLFSFDQEAIMNAFSKIDIQHNKYANFVRKQNDLRSHFAHIDDSLFALSLRQPQLGEKVNKEIEEVYYHIDKTIEQLADNQVNRANASQQYIVTAANTLADLLSSALNNMQMQMNASGQSGQGPPKPGQGKSDGGLPDIIKSQEQLAKEMQQGMQKGEEGKKGEGEKGQEGEKGKEGENGKEGDNGKKGKDGQNSKTAGDGEGSSEELNGEIYQIYQRQQQLRQALQDRIAKQGINPAANNLIKQMEQIELDLLHKGFTNQTLQKMLNLKHQLLKLENATFQQGKEEKRESNTNKQSYNAPTTGTLESAKKYFPLNEILNRQSFPFKPLYKKKVQTYFQQKNDSF